MRNRKLKLYTTISKVLLGAKAIALLFTLLIALGSANSDPWAGIAAAYFCAILLFCASIANIFVTTTALNNYKPVKERTFLKRSQIISIIILVFGVLRMFIY